MTIRTEEFGSREARELVLSCFNDLVREVDEHGGFVPSTNQPDLEKIEQRELSRERIVDLSSQIESCSFNGGVRKRAEDQLEAHSVSLHQLPTARQIDMLSGVARALLEQQRLFLLRMEDRLACAEPEDPLFRERPAVAPPAGGPLFEAIEAVRGPTVGEAVQQYLRGGEKQWVRKTLMARKWQLRYLEEHLGPGTSLASVTPHQIRSYRDGILALRANHGRTRSQSFREKQTDNLTSRIAGKTASLIFEPTKAFFRWCEEVEGLITGNPAQSVRLVPEKKPKGEKSRRPFRSDELEKLFSMPVFTGCQSVHRRYAPGKKVIQDAKYWIPILAYYSGARMGELVQLHLTDVHLDGDIPFLSINEDNAGASSAERKHVKSVAGIRRVPLHPDILELGFAEFVMSRRKRKTRSTRLFPEVSYGSDGQASTVFSKWFARLLDQSGLSDPTLVFHSLRHNAQDALRNAGQQQYVIDRIFGHSDTATSAGYGEGIDLETAHAAVVAMKLKVRLPQLWN